MKIKLVPCSLGCHCDKCVTARKEYAAFLSSRAKKDKTLDKLVKVICKAFVVTGKSTTRYGYGVYFEFTYAVMVQPNLWRDMWCWSRNECIKLAHSGIDTYAAGMDVYIDGIKITSACYDIGDNISHGDIPA